MSRDSKKRGRGSRTHGGGTQKNRRGAGHRGGRGDAGRKKHEAKNHPELGKTGFKRPQKVVDDVDVSNVGDIDRSIETLVERGVAEETDDGYTVDASALGVDKVLGSGQVRNTLTVHADDFSDSAVEKIESAGGEVVVTSDEDETEEEE
ncbi:uL15 family ribosomal protein [Haladaptatus sp. F3-133]|uniref:Large ribosomal subunit protein uL15 n=1 Tax=Halorutilus salinus TaxID=2487751 RepID=A0A9Q4GIS9_9EURY|nr:uL15m family ribosomal protein [Halorutilus salinus]MCX2818571.1 uL15 family ribosomal protein [Halorutilus salinus]